VNEVQFLRVNVHAGEVLETPADQDEDLDWRKEDCNTLSKGVRATRTDGCSSNGNKDNDL
jgi:hypothetical protein